MAADQLPPPRPDDGPTEVLAPGPMRELHALAASMGSSGPPRADAAADAAPRRRRRRAVAAILVAIAVLAVAGAVLRLDRDGSDPVAERATGAVPIPSDESADGPDGEELDIEVEGEGPPPGFALGGETGDGVDALDPIVVAGEWPGPSGGGGPAGPVPPPLPPQPDPQPPPPSDDGGGEPVPDPPDAMPEPEPTADPCAGLEGGAHLVTTPDPAHLAPGVMTSTLTIRNCGTDPVGWTAATKPSVALDDEGGTLPGGAEQAVRFTIDQSAFAGTAITFKIRVSEPGFNQYVDIEATKAGLADAGGAAPDPADTLTTGGPTGCAASCITKAWLTPNATTPDLSLDVETSTPARVAVFVSTAAPVAGPDGQPSFPDGGLIAATDDLNVVWSTALGPLVAATDYHIVVRATDVDGGVSNRVGTFRTVTPAVDPDLGEAAPGGDSGCATQCITRAWITPDPSSFDVELEVDAHTLARFEASISTSAPTADGDGNPVFADEAAATTTANFAYEKAWTTTLGPLEPATTYHVIVKATDGMFRSSFQVGSFTTRPGADQLLVSFHRIRVEQDGDAGANRGELSFVFGVDGVVVGTAGELKAGSGTTVHLSDGDRWPGISTVVPFDPSPSAWLPMLSVTGYERDADARAEFCSVGDLQRDPGSDGGCDVTWDVASSGLVPVGGLDGLASCPDLGVDAEEVATARCIELASAGNGSDYPRFTVIASLQPVTS